MSLGLLIDDQRNQHQVLRPALAQAFGSEPDSANTLAQAAQFLERKSYDYVILDPATESLAKSLTMILRHKHSDRIKPFCALLIISSESSPSFITSCADVAPDDILLKPIKTADMLSRLGAAMDKKAILRAPLLEMARHGQSKDTHKAFDLAFRSANTPAQQAQTLRAHAAFCLEQKDFPLALQLLGKLRLVSDTPATMLMLAELMLANGQGDKAVTVLKAILAEHPNFLGGYDLLAEALYSKGDGESGLKTRAQANALNPLNYMRSERLSKEAYDLGDMPLAQRALEFQLQHLTESEQEAGPKFAMLAQTLMAQNDVAGGLSALEKARKAIGGESDSSPALAIALLASALNQNQLGQAHELLGKLRQLDESVDGPKPYLSEAALCAYRLGEMEQGDQWLERVLLRQSLTFSHYQRIKEAMEELGQTARLQDLSRKAALSRASHAERMKQYKAAGMFMDIAQEMIENAEHADADIDIMLEALESIAEADHQGQLHQAAHLVVDSLRKRIEKLQPDSEQMARLSQISRRITSI